MSLGSYEQPPARDIHTCYYCKELIFGSERAEAEQVTDHNTPGLNTYHFHADCLEEAKNDSR